MITPTCTHPPGTPCPRPPRNGGIVPPWLEYPVRLPVLPEPSTPIPPVVAR